MPRIPPDILRLARNHHRQLLALDKKGRRAVEKQMALALEEVTAELEKMSPERFRAQQLRVVGLLADLTARLTSDRLENVLDASIRTMYALAPGHTIAEVDAWMEHYGEEARPLNLQAIANIAEQSIIERVPASLARWGPGIARRVRMELALTIATRGDRNVATAAIKRAIDGEKWRARRIVRTEMVGAYNEAHHRSLTAARDEHGVQGLKKSAIATFDARTDQDSYPVHGQVRELEEMFEDGDGRRYLHPPGRPNDREKEIPWLDPPSSPAPSPQEPDKGGARVFSSVDPQEPIPEHLREFEPEIRRMNRRFRWDEDNPRPSVQDMAKELDRGPSKIVALGRSLLPPQQSISLQFLADDEFADVYVDHGGDLERMAVSNAFTFENMMFVRARVPNKLIHVVHEGAHALDFVVNPAIKDEFDLELRAYLLEDDFREHHGIERVWKTRQRLVDYLKALGYRRLR